MLGNSSYADDGLCIVWLSTLEIPHTRPVQILQSWKSNVLCQHETQVQEVINGDYTNTLNWFKAIMGPL